MAWSKKTGTLPDKVKTLIVVDTSDSNLLKDLGDSGCVEGAGITLASQVAKVDRTTGGWGYGVHTPYHPSTFVPGEITFSDVGNGLPKWLDTNAADGTVIFLFNRVRSGETASFVNQEFCKISASNQPMLSTDASRIGRVGASGYTIASTGTTVLPTDTAFGVAMHARRSATAYWKYWYGTKSGGTFAQEGTTGTISDAGGLSTLHKLGTNAASGTCAYELFMVVVVPTEFLSEADMNSILSDPLGTLVNTGSGTANASGAGATATATAADGGGVGGAAASGTGVTATATAADGGGVGGAAASGAGVESTATASTGEASGGAQGAGVTVTATASSATATGYAFVTFQEPLYTGPGSIFYEGNYVGTPEAGDIARYSTANGLVVLPDGAIRIDSNTGNYPYYYTPVSTGIEVGPFALIITDSSLAPGTGATATASAAGAVAVGGAGASGAGVTATATAADGGGVGGAAASGAGVTATATAADGGAVGGGVSASGAGVTATATAADGSGVGGAAASGAGVTATSSASSGSAGQPNATKFIPNGRRFGTVSQRRRVLI